MTKHSSLVTEQIIDAILGDHDYAASDLIAQSSPQELDAQVKKKLPDEMHPSLCSPIHVAAYCGKTDLVETLLEYGADPNRRDEHDATALLYAAQFDHKDIIDLLVKKVGKKLEVNTANHQLFNPLYYLGRHGDQESIAALIGIGADINYDNGLTALCAAAAEGNLPLIDFLFDKGALPDRCFPLQRALNCQKEEAALLLLKRGTSPTKRNTDKRRPLDNAQHCHKVALDLLKRGADPNALDDQNKTPFLNLVLVGKNPALLGPYIEHGGDLHALIDTHPLLRKAIDAKTDASFVHAMLEHGADRFAPCAKNDLQSLRDYYTRALQQTSSPRSNKKQPVIDWDHLSDNAQKFLEAPATCGLPLIANGKATFLLQELCGAHKLREAFAPEKWQGHGREAFRLCRRLHDALPDYWQQRYKSIAPDLPPLVQLAHEPDRNGLSQPGGRRRG